MAKTRDVAHDTNTWYLTNTRGDHQMSDLTGLFMKILRGTTLAPEALDEPLTTCDVHEAVWNDQTSCMADTRHGCHSQDIAPTVKARQALVIRLTHGPKASHAETWPQWTSFWQREEILIRKTATRPQGRRPSNWYSLKTHFFFFYFF